MTTTVPPLVAPGVWLDVFVPGRPISQGSKTVTRYGMRESSKDLAPWRERVAYTARQAYGPDAPIERTRPVGLQLEFVMPRPGATPKRSTPPAIRMPDLDKCIRAVGDALTHVIYTDDAQIVSIFASKRLAELDEGPGVYIRVVAA